METVTKRQAVTKGEDRCLPITENIRLIGESIGVTNATTYVANYLAAVNDLSGDSHNYGFVFGLDPVDAFRAEIEAYNKNLAEGELKIAGIRVFFGLKAPGAGTVALDKAVDTLFFMPVLEDGTDLYAVHRLLDSVRILGSPRPCPNECKRLYFSE